jgi:apolipoprotein N-acyltransferase
MTVMTSDAPPAELIVPIDAKPVAECGAFQPLTAKGLILWGSGAVVSFHGAYEFFAPLMLVFLVCMYRVGHVASRPQAMYSGWVIGLAIYGPQLAFFWNIFGFGAIGLWLILATWLSVYLVLQRFALLKLGPVFGAIVAPFLWTGVEYFRSELYYLRFSWLNVGYSFAPLPQHGLIPWFGMYGIGFVLMGFASHFPFANRASPRRKCIWTLGLATLVLTGIFLDVTGKVSGQQQLKVAGVQLEFADEETVLAELDKLEAKFPGVPLYVLSEYSFDGPVPERIRAWCATNGKYLIAGGKDYADALETQFRNTAFVIGPDGKQVFSQVKAVPIQFFKDGLPAEEQRVWDSPWGKVGLCVCYDLSYTRVTDELVRQGALAIIVPTMDVEEWGQRQHVLHSLVAPIRAAEYDVPIFRLCSSGISQAVNQYGKVLATAPFPGQGRSMEATIDLPHKANRPLDRFVVWPCVAICALLLGWHVVHSFRRERRSRQRAGPQ